MNISLEDNGLRVSTDSPDETQLVGTKLAGLLEPGIVIGLSGELGAGKTCFTKGVALGLDVDEKVVTSPTFVLMNTYNGKYPIRHFDCYRLAKGNEIFELGFYDFLADSVIIIEWVDRITNDLGPNVLLVDFQVVGEHSRSLILTARGSKPGNIVNKLCSILPHI